VVPAAGLRGAAFRLHEHIAYGGAFGEYLSYGRDTYATTFALWWAAWAIGIALCAAWLRAAIAAAVLAVPLVRPRHAPAARRALERLGLVVSYAGVPAWLLWRAL